MSEYQYYEFRAVDKTLNELQMKELRSISTRAKITPTYFTNTYHFGSFKGNAETFMEKYFDAFCYVANWGSHEFMVRLPARLIDRSVLEFYCCCSNLSYKERGDNCIIEFSSDIEPNGEFEDGESWLPSLLQIRSDLFNGDYRSLYLGWLSSIQAEEPSLCKLEPIVPAGLSELTDALDSLADFLRIDRNLVEVAAKASLDMVPGEANLQSWLRSLAATERESMLEKFIEGNDPHLRGAILRQIRADQKQSQSNPRRTVGELLQKSKVVSETKRRMAEEHHRLEKERKEMELAAARASYLDDVEARQDQVWQQIEILIEMKSAAEYDRAVVLLTDLRDLFLRSARNEDFRRRARGLRERHSRKPSFVKRMDQKGL